MSETYKTSVQSVTLDHGELITKTFLNFDKEENAIHVMQGTNDVVINAETFEYLMKLGSSFFYGTNEFVKINGE